MSKITPSSADYQTFPTLFDLEPVAGKKVTVDFTAPELSSLGGLTLVREYERSSSRIIERIESCIKDPRWEPMVIHSQTEMLRQRIYQIMAGFEDADDCDRLCRDGILKMCAGRSASDEIDLASHPTMTRLENRLSRKELFDIGEAFIDDFIASYESEPDSIIIDADDTNADTYGAQQLTLFNAYYGEYCYMLMLLFEGRSGKLILPILRPGRGNKAINIAGLLKRLILKLRKKWKHTQIIVRGDSHFCSHDFMDWATDRQDGIHFITGLAGNVKLKRISEGWLQSAIASYEATGEEVRTFHSFVYKAKSWKHQQRVVVKIEVNNLGTNVRYVVTDFKGQRSSFIYSDCYCDRGRMEQMIAELKNGLNADRMSCNKFSANQFRLYLHCAAYVILHSFQAAMLLGGKWLILDPLVGGCISIFIIYIAVKIAGPSISELTDASLSDEVESEIEGIISDVSGVMDVHEMKTRQCGRYSIVEAHIVVDPESTVREAHRITDIAEERLRQKYGEELQITLHIEPSVDSK